MLRSALFLTLAGLTTLLDAAPVVSRDFNAVQGTGSKRGLAFPKQYNGQAGSQWTKHFTGAKVSWMYDWEAVIDGQPLSNLEYVPLLHSNQQWCTQGWTQNVANARKQYNVKNILAFNEPDQVGGGGTGIAVADAVIAYKQFVQPLAAQGLRLGSPAVTNGVGPNKGVEYLKQFIAQCTGCTVDFVVAHYYAWDKPEDFKNYLTKFHETFNKPVWVTEFGVTSGDADAFLTQVLPWLDAQPWIERYAYQMTAPASGQDKFLINSAGTGLSSTGTVYATT